LAIASQHWIWIALGVSIVAFAACIWQLSNMRGVKARGRRRSPAPEPQASRKGDVRILSSSERKLYAESQRLLAQNKVQPAARILEQLNMPREAIQALEDAGLIHEAAKILMRMQRANRAGVIYARHAMWENAAQCFKLANMPLEVAKCAREAGNLPMAAEYFEKVGRHEDAAECFEQLGDYHRAARQFSQAGNRPRAMQLYSRLATSTQNLAALKLEEDELQQIVDYMADGHTEQGLADVVAPRNKLTEVVLNLVAKKMVRQASEVYLRATTDIGPMLMAEVNYQDGSAAALADVFVSVSNFHYAGMVYERLNDWLKGADAFEKAEDYERAAYCHERAGNESKVKALKEKARNNPFRGRSGNAHFALSTVGGDGSEDGATAVIDTNKSPAHAPPPIPVSSTPAPAPAAPASPSMRLRSPSSAPPPPWSPPAPQPLGEPGGAAGAFSLKLADDSELENEPVREVPRAATPPIPAVVETPVASIPPAPVSIQPEAEDPNEESALPPVTGQAPVEPVSLDEGRAAFHKAKFLADLDFEQKNKLWNIGATNSYREGQTILNYNEAPRGVYIIIQGSVSCYKQVGGKESYVDQMGEAESFGELWLLADQPTAVRFVASKATKLRVIDRGAFTDLLDKDGTIARKVYKRFTLRLLKRLLKPQNLPGNREAS
jgi:hypothetical protein